MATREFLRFYEEDDMVDEYLLNQLSKWILYHRLRALARHLGISQAEYIVISLETSQPEERIFKILQKWHTQKLLTVKDMIMEMACWIEKGHADKKAWKYFSNIINPAALPISMETLQQPVPLTGSHPLQLAFMQTSGESAALMTTSSDSQMMDSTPNTGEEQPLGSFQIDQLSANNSATQVLATDQLHTVNSVNQVSMGSSVSGQVPSQPSANSFTAAMTNQPPTGAIMANKLSAGCISLEYPSTDPPLEDQPSAGSILAHELCVGTITSTDSAASLITAGQLSVGSISSGQPSEGSVIAGKIAAVSITVGQMSCDTIAADKISVCPTAAHNLPTEGIDDFKVLLKESLRRNLKYCLKHDWLEEGVNFPLMKYYTDLVWVKEIKEAMGREKKPMKGMDEIIEVPGAGEKGLNVLVEAKPGMGKTCSMAKLAMIYVENDKNGFPFNFVFFIALRDVDENCPLAKVIIDQHDQLEQEHVELVQSILKGKTKHKVLLLLDGYDEYTRGTNREIDRAIERTVGKCFLILTSRPQNGKDFSKTIRNKMDGEVVMEGFNDENIVKCCSLFLGSERECDKFLEEVKKQSTAIFITELEYTGLYELLRIPIMLLMLCVLYKENIHKCLPERKTQIYDELYELLMNRTTLKPSNFGCESSEVPNIDNMLITLGKFAWEAFHNEVKQLLLNKDDLEKECPNLMKLGLVSVVKKEHASRRKIPNYVSYGHKLLQEFGASKFVTYRLDTAADVKVTLRELFPSWESVIRQQEIIYFTVGLVKDPKPRVDYLYKMQIKEILKSDGSNPPIHTYLFESLFAESSVPLPDQPLHNQFINCYDHMDPPRDITPIRKASKLYEFTRICEDIVFNIEQLPEGTTKIPDCILRINDPDAFMTKDLLSMCRAITKQQVITTLYLSELTCDDLLPEPGVFNLSEHARSVRVEGCTLPVDVMSHLMQQLSKCTRLSELVLSNTSLVQVTDNLLQFFKSLADNAPLQRLHLTKTYHLFDSPIPAEVWTELFTSLSTYTHLIDINLSFNDITGCLSSFISGAHQSLPTLRKLNLTRTALDAEDVRHLFETLQCNKLPKLQDLYLSQNTLTGCLSSFLPDPRSGLPELEKFYMVDCGLNLEDLRDLRHLIQQRKLPGLAVLSLDKNRECMTEKEEVGLLIETCMARYQKDLQINLQYNNLPEAFKKTWRQRCEKTNIIVV